LLKILLNCISNAHEHIICFELNRYEVIVVICSVNCANKHKRCCYLPFSLSPFYNELRNVFACIAMHFLAIFIVCKFAFCFYS